MKHATVVLFLTVAFVSLAFAEDEYGTVEGIIFKKEVDVPLEGASVLVVGTGLGDATDRHGLFRIEEVPAGEVELEVKLIGYKNCRQRITVLTNRVNEVQIHLEPDVLVGSAVMIEGERVDDIRLKITPPTFVMKPQEIQNTAGGLNDVMRSLQTLPGLVGTSDYSNQFVVRGGAPDQNLILLDDVEIYNPYRSSGMPAPINPAIIQNVNLYAGAYPAMFGDRLSAVLAIHSRDGSTNRWLGGRIALNTLDANFMLDGKFPAWNGSWLFSGRKSHNQLFAEDYAKRLTLNSVALPDYEDWNAEIVFRPNERIRLQFHGLYGQNKQDWLVRGELGEQDTERAELDGGDQVDNLAVGLSLNYQPTDGSQVNVFANFYKNTGSSGFASDLIPNNDEAGLGPAYTLTPPPEPFGVIDTALFNYKQQFDFRRTSYGAWFVQETPKHIWEAGFGYDLLDNSIRGELGLNDFGGVVFRALRSAPNWFGAIADSAEESTNYQRIHFYAQDKASFFGGRGYFQPGLRFDFYGVTSELFVSPRIKFGFKIDPVTTFTSAVGVYRQSPGYEKLLDGGEIFDILRLTDLSQLSSERALHAQVGVNHWLNDQIQVGLEFYYKTFDHLIAQPSRLTNRPAGVYVSGAPGLSSSYRVEERLAFVNIHNPQNDISGEALGLDFVLEKRVIDASDRWSGRLAYSLARSIREQTIEGQRLAYVYDFDRRHSLHFTFNYRLFSKFTVGATWNVGTGFPYTPAVGVEPLIGIFEPDSATTVNVVFSDPATGFARFLPTFGGGANINSARLPDYHRLDIRVSYAASVFESNWNFYLDFINVYDHKNVLFYRNIIRIEGADENLPPSLRFPKPVLLREPVYMYPFIPSFGVEIAF